MTTSDAASPTPSNTAQTAEATPTVEPQRLQAAPQDVERAQAEVPVPGNPHSASPIEIDRLRDLLAVGQTTDGNVEPDTVAESFGANSNVLQWQPDWVRHDNFRPVIVNPFRDWLQIVYLDGGNPQILRIEPLKSALVDLAEGAYSITVMVLDAVGRLDRVAVGSLVSGPPPASVTNVPVVVNYTDKTYKPIVVRQITDLGNDPNVGGERKVLLDGQTPAWGRWTETPSGERQFEVNKTQQFPGIDTPAEGPLPGQYQLASASEPTSGLGIFLLIVLAVAAGLGVGAMAVRIRRAKPRPRHGRQGMRVQAVSRPGSPPVITVRETAADGEKSHAVRLAAHPDPGTLTIREVHDDHTRAE